VLPLLIPALLVLVHGEIVASTAKVKMMAWVRCGRPSGRTPCSRNSQASVEPRAWAARNFHVCFGRHLQGPFKFPCMVLAVLRYQGAMTGAGKSVAEPEARFAAIPCMIFEFVPPSLLFYWQMYLPVKPICESDCAVRTCLHDSTAQELLDQ